jgi:PAS domain S-box-containing protein
MNEAGKNKNQLLAELKRLRSRVRALEKKKDLFERQKSAFQDERNLLRAMINNIPDCHIFLKDRYSRFVITNDYQLKILGLKDFKEIIGKTDFDFFPKDFAERFYCDEQEIIKTGKPLFNREEKTIDSKGREYWLLTTKVPLFSSRGKVVGIVGVSGKKAYPENVCGIVGIGRDITGLKKLELEREKLIIELKDAFTKIKTLHGLIPICASCKKIRDDKGFWHQVEKYISEHSDADFSHGYCPECYTKITAELGLAKNNFTQKA